ncbi:hypothetical protein BH11PSE11_BH11PSE11_07630 [soil metagenome]
MNQLISQSRTFALLLAAATSAFGAAPLHEPGAMVREGTWADGAGMYYVPEALEKLTPSKWPLEGWSRLSIESNHIRSEPVLVPKGKMPAFLNSIVRQREAMQSDSTSNSVSPSEVTATENATREFYLRVPGTRLRSGAIPVHVFRNGTPALRPQLDYRYALKLNSQAFAFTVRNGLRGKHGEAYGEGAQYTIEYDGKTYLYSLGQFGWDSTIAAIADMDGDGKPDFVIYVGGNNSGYEAVLLSSKAKPGRNVATASLTQGGC